MMFFLIDIENMIGGELIPLGFESISCIFFKLSQNFHSFEPSDRKRWREQ